MEMALVKKEGKVWTRFKINKKDKDNWLIYLYAKFGIDIKKPAKENSKFIYFEKEGDLLNGK